MPLALAIIAAWLVAAVGTAGAMPPPELGLRRGSSFYLDYNGDAIPDAIVAFGLASDIGLVGDFDGDTLTDTAVFRGGKWFIALYNDSVANRTAAFGVPGDIPMAADVNGDGLTDLVLYRPSTGVWYVNYSQGGAFSGIADLTSAFGGGVNDVPVIADFDGDGRADRAIYKQGFWHIDTNWSGIPEMVCAFGGLPGDVPLAADFDGDGAADLVIFRAGVWHVDTNCDGIPDSTRHYGAAGDWPLTGSFNPAQSLFVSAGAPKGGNGTQRAPFRKIPAAVAQAIANTVIRIAAGTYPAPIVIANRAGLTLAGAGWTATHLTGGGAPGSDVASIVKSTGIVLRNLHVASPDQRGVVVQGSSVALDRVSTAGTRSDGVLATAYLGSAASLSIAYSRLDQSQIGTGLRLEPGSVVSIVGSSVSGNGTAPQVPPAGGRGVVVLGDSRLEMLACTVSGNHDGGILVDNTTSPSAGWARVTDSIVERNGTNGIIYGNHTSGLLARNVISENGQRGTRGATTGFNGIELLSGWNGPSMIIKSNVISDNTGNGVLVGSGVVTVKNNVFDNNWLAMTIFNAPTIAADVLIQGNTFDTDPPTINQTGVYIQETWGNPIVRIGGPASAQRTGFKNYLGRPAIACEIGTAATTCPLSWNQFVNSSVPVQLCDCDP